jgi:hypothetical protein
MKLTQIDLLTHTNKQLMSFCGWKQIFN